MFDTQSSSSVRTRSVAGFMYKVYAWMTGALALTAVTSYSVYSNTPLFMSLMTNKIAFWGLIIAQIGVVILLAKFINRLSFFSALFLFAAYAALLGVTLSVIFQVYELSSIYTVLGITAGTFGTMAIYGYVTKSDLTSIGSAFMMALFGLIIASFVNIFIGNRTFDIILSFVGVLIFTGLVAYDVQKIKAMSTNLDEAAVSPNKLALLGALTLYLDFINLFLYILRLLGKQRD